MNKTTTHILIIIYINILFSLTPSITQRHNITTSPAASSDTIKLRVKKETDIPIRLIIPSAKINVDVVKSKIIGNTWETSETSASFGEGSSPLNEKWGNSIIFAHARPGLFRNLKDVKNGDLVTIFGKHGIYTYKITTIWEIMSDEVDIAKSTGTENITLFTCETGGDKYRLVVKGKLIESLKYDLKEVT